MWRVILSVVALVFDGLILIFSIGLALNVSVSVESGGTTSASTGDSHASQLGGIMFLVLMLINIAAILFGARIRAPGSQLKAVSSIFE